LVRKNNDERKILLHDIGAVDFDHVQQVYDAVKYQLLRETNGDTKDQPSQVIDDIVNSRASYFKYGMKRFIDSF